MNNKNKIEKSQTIPDSYRIISYGKDFYVEEWKRSWWTFWTKYAWQDWQYRNEEGPMIYAHREFDTKTKAITAVRKYLDGWEERRNRKRRVV